MPKRYPDRIAVNLKKGSIDRIAEQAAKRGLTPDHYLRDIIMQRLASAENKERQRAQAKAQAQEKQAEVALEAAD